MVIENYPQGYIGNVVPQVISPPKVEEVKKVEPVITYTEVQRTTSEYEQLTQQYNKLNSQVIQAERRGQEVNQSVYNRLQDLKEARDNLVKTGLAYYTERVPTQPAEATIKDIVVTPSGFQSKAEFLQTPQEKQAFADVTSKMSSTAFPVVVSPTVSVSSGFSSLPSPNIVESPKQVSQGMFPLFPKAVELERANLELLGRVGLATAEFGGNVLASIVSGATSAFGTIGGSAAQSLGIQLGQKTFSESGQVENKFPVFGSAEAASKGAEVVLFEPKVLTSSIPTFSKIASTSFNLIGSAFAVKAAAESSVEAVTHPSIESIIPPIGYGTLAVLGLREPVTEGVKLVGDIAVANPYTRVDVRESAKPFSSTGEHIDLFTSKPEVQNLKPELTSPNEFGRLGAFKYGATVEVAGGSKFIPYEKPIYVLFDEPSRRATDITVLDFGRTSGSRIVTDVLPAKFPLEYVPQSPFESNPITISSSFARDVPTPSSSLLPGGNVIDLTRQVKATSISTLPEGAAGNYLLSQTGVLNPQFGLLNINPSTDIFFVGETPFYRKVLTEQMFGFRGEPFVATGELEGNLITRATPEPQSDLFRFGAMTSEKGKLEAKGRSRNTLKELFGTNTNENIQSTNTGTTLKIEENVPKPIDMLSSEEGITRGTETIRLKEEPKATFTESFGFVKNHEGAIVGTVPVKGSFEPTLNIPFVGLRPSIRFETANLPEIRTNLEVSTNVKSREDLLPISRLGNLPSMDIQYRTSQTNEPVQRVEPVPRLKPDVVSMTAQVQEPIQRLEQPQERISQPLIPGRPGPTVEERRPFEEKFTLTPRPFRNPKKEEKKRVKAQVRRAGKFETIDIQEDITKATESLVRRIKNTAAASGRITTETGKTLKIETPRGFEPSKREFGVVIEPRSQRIKSQGEKEQVTMKGLRALASKRRMQRGGFL